MANAKKRRKLIIFSIIGIVLVALTLVAILTKKEPIITVQTEKVIRRDITERVMANGKIQPVTQVVISPEVAGEITALPVKEGDRVKKGDLLLQIKPDNYQASRNSAEASYKSAIAGKNLMKAQLDKAEAEFKRNQELYQNRLVSDSVFLEFKTAYEVAKLQYENAAHNEDQAKFGLDRAADDLSKTTITSPIDGTVTKLNSELGERVLGTSFNKGTEIMIVSDLSAMEAVVDIGEMDVVLIKPEQKARLEVDAFKDRKFSGIVSEVANSAKGLGQSVASSSQDATKFEVHIGITEKESFRPGMSVTAEIETRYRTNVLTVPIASVTTRMPRTNSVSSTSTNLMAKATNPPDTNVVEIGTNCCDVETNVVKLDKKSNEPAKPIDVVFVMAADKAKMVPVKIGISDQDYWEITEGLREGEEVVSGGYKAISRDLDDGKKIAKGTVGTDEKKEL